MAGEFRDITVKSLIVLILKHLVSRSIFFLYSFIAVWRVTKIKSSGNSYWYLLLTLAPLGIELVYVVCSQKTTQHKWLSPDVMSFFLCVIPCVWILETELLARRQSNFTTMPVVSSNSSRNSSILTTVASTLIPSSNGVFDTIIYYLNSATDEGWTLGLEQSLIFVLVLSKWIAPIGTISLDALSQLLLVYITSGVDIVELFGAFEDRRVRQSYGLVIATLILWSWSLLQFTLHLTATKNPPILDEDIDKMVALVNFFKYVNPEEAAVSKSAWLQISEEINKGNLRVSRVQEKRGRKRRETLTPKSVEQQFQLLPNAPNRSTLFAPTSQELSSGKSANTLQTPNPHPSGVSRSCFLNHKITSRFSDDHYCFGVDAESCFVSPFPSAIGNPFHQWGQSTSNVNQQQQAQLNKPLTGFSTATPTRENKHLSPRDAHRKTSNKNSTSANSSSSYETYSKSSLSSDDYEEETIQIELPGSYKKGPGYVLVMPAKASADSTFLGGFQLLRQDGTAIDPNEVKQVEPEEEASALSDWFSCLGKRRFDCFCFYNEIWGLIANLIFQDVPFLIMRLTILLYYQIVTRLIILFLFKNFFVIVLNLNRIRAIIRTERQPWLEFTQKLHAQDEKKQEKE